MINDIIDKIESIEYGILFPEFQKQHYIFISKDYMYRDGKKVDYRYEVEDNAVYLIDKVPYAVWNMDNNYEYWSVEDIVAGMVHEMFHCHQVQLGKYKEFENRVFDDKTTLCLLKNIERWHEDLNKQDLLILWEDIDKDILIHIIDVQEIEGLALWVEFRYKELYANKSHSRLLGEYYEYLTKSANKNKLIHYYMGAIVVDWFEQRYGEIWKNQYITNKISFHDMIYNTQALQEE